MKNSIFGLALLTTTALVATEAQATFENDYKSSGEGTYTFSGNETLQNDLGKANHNMEVKGNGATLKGNQHAGMELQQGRNVTVDDGLDFEGFKKNGEGAVLNNSGTFELTGDANFSNNAANRSGGVFNNEAGGTITLKDGEHTFENNSAGQPNTGSYGGGVLYNKGTVEMSGTNTFKDNKADRGFSGAIHNVGQVTLDGTTTFEGNRAKGMSDLGRGGAVSNHKDMTITGDKVTFKDNESYMGGAVYNDQSYSNMGVLNIETEETEFSGNKADTSGGAIANGTDVNIGGHATFKDNEARSGGAIENKGGNVKLNDVVFDGNTATEVGGAIYNSDLGGGSTTHDKGIVIVEGTAEFSNNKAKTGSAIYNVKAYTGDNADASVTFEKDVSFSGNTATNMGGAVYNSGTVTAQGHTTFDDNHAKYGGAVVNYGGTVDFQGENEFNNNTSTNGGGALYNWNKGTVKLGKSAAFSGNSTNGANGGAVYNDSTSTIEGQDLSFSKNTSSNMGGAVYNTGTVTASGHATFNDNNAKYGGAVLNYGGTVDLQGENEFNNNTSTNGGGAIYNWNGTVKLGESAVFSGNNTSDSNGGAVYNDSTSTIEGRNLSFSNNTSSNMGGAVYNTGTVTASGNAAFEGNQAKNGGAVYNSGTVNIESGETHFSNNTSTDMGGAVYNKGTMTNTGHTTFEENKSKSGGAVMNSGGTLDLKGGSDFKNNTSTKSGGAVYNWKEGHMTLEGETTFTDNVAGGEKGGAIYNDAGSDISIKGNAVFSGNRVNGADGDFNDIHNDGTIDVAEDSTLTLDGGITGSGNLTFEDGSALVAKVGKTTITNHVTNKGAELTLLMENGYEGGTVDLIGEGGSLDQDFELKNSNTFYDFNQSDKTGSYEVSKKSTEDLKDMLHADANEAAAAGALIYGRASEDNQTFNDMADAVFAKLQSPETIQEGLDDITAMSPEVADVVQQEQTAVSNQIFGAVGSRLSNGIASGRSGISSGDDPFRDVTVWAQILDNHAELDDSEAAHGFDSDTYGVALGVEKKLSPFLKAGIGYAYAKTNIDGFRRETDVNTHTGLLYGEYKPSNWFVNGIVSYGWSDYKEKKNVSDYLLRAKYDVDTLGMQLMTGYEFFAPYGVKFVPEVGLRYLYLDQDSYTDTAGIRITGRTSDVLTAVFGAKISQPWLVARRVVVTPELRVATTYDMKRADADSVVSLPNGQSYEVRGRPLNRTGVEIGASLTAEVNDNTDVSANYEGHFRDHYQDHTGLLGVKYKL